MMWLVAKLCVAMLFNMGSGAAFLYSAMKGDSVCWRLSARYIDNASILGRAHLAYNHMLAIAITCSRASEYSRPLVVGIAAHNKCRTMHVHVRVCGCECVRAQL